MTILYSLEQLRTPALDTFFLAVSSVAGEALAFVLIFVIYWCRSKRLASALCFSFFSSGALIHGIKVVARVPRPWVIDPEFHAVEEALPGASGYSFPSGHSQTAASVYGLMGLWFRRWFLRLLCFVFVLLTGFSRMYLGVHTPQDVAVGLVIGLISAFLWYWLLIKKDLLRTHFGLLTSILIVLQAALLILCIALIASGTVTPELGMDGIKSSAAGLGFTLGICLEKKFVSFAIPSSARQTALRLIVGGGIALLFFLGLKPLLGTSVPACFCRYFISLFWISFLFPLLFTKFEGRKKNR